MDLNKINWEEVGENIYEVLENAPDTVDPLFSVFEDSVDEVNEDDYAIFCKEVKRRITKAFYVDKTEYTDEPDPERFGTMIG